MKEIEAELKEASTSQHRDSRRSVDSRIELNYNKHLQVNKKRLKKICRLKNRIEPQQASTSQQKETQEDQ